MKNAAIILLSVLLAAALISILILYRHYIDTKDEFLINKEKLSDLNEEIIQLKQKNPELNDQVRENINNLNELKVAKTRISELEDIINTKNNAISDFEEKFRSLESDLQGKVKGVEKLETEISSKNSIVTELQERFKSALSRISEHENMIIEYKNELEVFQDRISKLQKKNLESEAQAEGIKTGYEATIFDLNREIQSRDETIAGLKNRFEEFEFEIRSLNNEISKCQGEYENLLLRIPEIQGEKEQLKSNIDQLQSTYDAIASELSNQVRDKEVIISELQDKFSITFVDRVLFKLGKATITPEGGKILTKVGKNLRSVHDRRIRVIGHTDNIPIMDAYRYKFPSNWELSAARAAAVVRHFQKEIGLNPQSLEAVGRSFYEPITSNESEEGRARNRRVEIIIAPLIE